MSSGTPPPTLSDGHDPATIDDAVARLRAGQPVAMPTETVYGLAADARSDEAVARVFELKGRPKFDPLIAHIADPARWDDVAEGMSDAGRELAEALWPGPLTLVAPRRAGAVADLVTSGLSTVAVRCPSHPIARRLIDGFGGPVAAPSANRFGAVSPTRAEHVASEFAGVDLMIIDGGPCERGLESTVIRAIAGQPIEVLRLGAIPLETIAEVTGDRPTVRAATSRPTEDAAAESPGMLDRHYAPRTPLRLMSVTEAAAMPRPARAEVGLLGSDAALAGVGDGFAMAVSLGDEQDGPGMAARLFAAMRELDEAGIGQIVAVPVPDVGLGRAINDRLSRASA